MKKIYEKNWDSNPKKNEKNSFYSFFFILSLKKLKTYTYGKFSKAGLNFREENTKMQKCRFPEISKNFRLSKSVLFSRNEIAPISLQRSTIPSRKTLYFRVAVLWMKNPARNEQILSGPWLTIEKIKNEQCTLTAAGLNSKILN